MPALELATGYISLAISTKGTGKQIVREFSKAGTEGGTTFSRNIEKTTAKSGKRVGTSFGAGILGGLKGIAGPMAALFAVGNVVSFFKEANAEARESQKVGAMTTQVIKTTGKAAKVTAGHVSELATAISNKTGVDDEAIQSNANLLLTFTKVRNEAGKGNDVFDQATQTVLDMSVAFKQSGKASAVQLGKALQDPVKGVTALARVGVTFTDQQKKQIATLVKSGDTLGAQKIILAELKKETGGAAAASATAGEKLTVVWGNFKEQVGTAVLPIVDKLATFLSTKVIPGMSKLVTFLATNVGPAFNKVKGFVNGLLSAFGGLDGITRGVTEFFRALTTGQAEGTDNPWMDKLVDLGVRLRPVLVQVGNVIQTTILPALKKLGNFVLTVVLPAWLQWQTFMAAQFWPLIKQLATFFVTNILPAFKVIVNFIITQVVPGFLQIVGVIKGLIAVVLPIVRQLVAVILSKFNEMRPQIMSIWTSVKEIITGVMFIIKEVILAVTKIIKLIWDRWGEQIKAVVGGTFKAIIGIVSGLMKIIAGIIKLVVALIKGDWSGAWNAIKQIFAGVWQAIKAILVLAWTIIQQIFAKQIAAVKTKWTQFATAIKTTASNMINSVKTVIADGLTKVRDGFAKAVAAIGKAWAEIKAVVAKPVKFVIDVVLNDGILAAVRSISKFVNYGPGKSISVSSKGFATGTSSVLRGYTPGRDVHRFYSATGGVLNLSGGEGIARPEIVRAVGRKRWDQMNLAAAHGQIHRARDLGSFAAGTSFLGGQRPVPAGSTRRHSGYSWARWAGDLSAGMNTPVHAWKSGVIAAVKYLTTSYGRHIIENVAGSRVYYAHLARATVHAGQKVNQGQVIGYSDSTGNSTGPHLHFEIRGGSAPISGSAGGGGGILAALSPAKWLGQVTTALGKLKSIKDSPFGEMIAGVPELIGSKIKDKISSLAASFVQTVKGAAGAAFTALTGGSNRAIGRRMMLQRWGAGEWPPLNSLWTRESGWRTTARNPSSGAYGIPQALPASKMASAGSDWRTNPATQIKWGLGYIASRYGSPSRAWAHSRATGWYANGTLNAPPGWGVVGEHGPELMRFHGGEQVIPNGVGGEMGGVVVYGGVHGHSVAEVADEIEKRARRARALRPIFA